jgi:DNA repair exonuclease SbcCD ATPase subunit
MDPRNRGAPARSQSQITAVASAEIAQLQSANALLKERLERAEAEVRAQHDELMAAAESMAEERESWKEEKEEYAADREEELDALRRQHRDQIAQLRASHQVQIRTLQDELNDQRAEYRRQGGDLSSEVSKAVEEKTRAVEQAKEMKAKHDALQQRFEELAQRHESLRDQCAALEQSAELARQAERRSDERLDASLEQYKHQLSLRQARETELERTVAELGAALSNAAATAAQQATVPVEHPHSADSLSSHEYPSESLHEIKAKHAVAVEELESTRSELRVALLRCEALQRDVQDMSTERDAEAAMSQERQRKHDERMAELAAQVQRLQRGAMAPASGVSNGQPVMTGDTPSDAHRLQQAVQELRESKRQVSEFSDQLIRLQGIAESSKAEVLALKGRLHAANARADSAEVALASASTSSYDVEGGGDASASKTRRRIKGGLRALGGGLARPNHLAPRSIRAALGIRAVHGSALEQVALTVDALDNWMMDTGSILKAEPLARVALAVYLTILHCWCFALVFFHAVESEHGDLGALTHRGGPLHLTKK